MKVSVNGDRCQGHARCVFFAPEVFDIDDEGYAVVSAEHADVPAELQAKVRKAAANCPELSIIVTE